MKFNFYYRNCDMRNGIFYLVLFYASLCQPAFSDDSELSNKQEISGNTVQQIESNKSNSISGDDVNKIALTLSETTSTPQEIHTQPDQNPTSLTILPESQKENAIMVSESNIHSASDISISSTNPSGTQRLLKILIIVAVLAFITLFIGGLTDTVVVWYDWTDFLITASIFISGFLGFVFGYYVFDDDTTMRNGIYAITGIIMLGLVIQTMRLSINHNENLIIGIIVGIFKVSLSLIMLVFVLGALSNLLDDKKPISAKIITFIMLGLFGWIAFKMVNGERVYEKRGYE